MAEINGPGKDNVIHIGDIISLKFPKLLSYLSAEGILSEDVYVSPSTHFFEEHLFQVYVQRQYSATNELEEFMEGLEAEGHDITKPPADPSTASHMEALVKGKDNEFVLNKSVMKSKTGNVVCFGDTIQLLHVKSNKYITVKPADLARDERENMKVALSHDGSVMSWLKVMPRFKIDREGEPITNGTEVLLRIAERSTEFIHCADRAPPKGKFREVNSSMEVPTGWKLSVFHKTSDIKNVAHLLTGQLVSIKDPELQCMLAPLAKKIDLDPPVSESKPSTAAVGRKSMQLFQTPHSSASLPVNQEDDESDAALDDQSLASKDEFLRDYGSVVLRPMLEDIVDSDTLWMVETRAITRGGQIKFLTDRVHLRHFNTGKYLAVDQNEYDPDLFFLSLEDEPNDKRTLFFITELHSSIEFLGNAKAVQIKHAYHGAYLQRGIHHDEQRVYTCTTTRSKSKAVSMIINRYEQKEGINVIKSLQMKEETLDIYFGKAVMYHIEKFVKATAVPLVIRHDSASIWPRIDVTDRAFFSTLMGRTTLFVRGYPIHIRAITDEMATGRGRKHVVVRRQNMFREQGLLQAMMIMIKFLQPISDLLNSDSGNSRVAKSQFVENGREILSDCLHLLYDLIHENMVNQLYISDHLLIIFSHVSSDKMAAKIAQELLSSNRELQETKVGEREITIFTAKMREVHMNSMYLQLLQTCCSCMVSVLYIIDQLPLLISDLVLQLDRVKDCQRIRKLFALFYFRLSKMFSSNFK